MKESSGDSPRRVSAARRLFAEIHRTRRAVLMHPESDELRERCLGHLVDVAEACLSKVGQVTIALHEDHLFVEDELVFAAAAADNSFAPWFDAGIRRISVSHPLAARRNVEALLELLNARTVDPSHSARSLWAASIPGIEFDYGDQGGLRGARSFTALRLAAVPVTEPTPALRAAIEREIAIDPAVRIVAELFDTFRARDEPRCPTEWNFVTKILSHSLEGLELNTAAAILAAAERCRVLLDSQRRTLLGAATRICDADWWQRAAETAGVECREPLSALILQIGIDRDAAERVLAVGPTAAATAILQCAPDAASRESVEQMLAWFKNDEFAPTTGVAGPATSGTSSDDTSRVGTPKSG